MYTQIENVVATNAILFLPCVLRRSEHIAYEKLVAVLLCGPGFDNGTAPPLMVMTFALGPLSAISGKMKEAGIRTYLYRCLGWISDSCHRRR